MGTTKSHFAFQEVVSVPDKSEFAFLLTRALKKNTSLYVDPLMLFEEIRLGMRKTTPLLGELKQTGHQDGGTRGRKMRERAGSLIIWCMSGGKFLHGKPGWNGG